MAQLCDRLAHLCDCLDDRVSFSVFGLWNARMRMKISVAQLCDRLAHLCGCLDDRASFSVFGL